MIESNYKIHFLNSFILISDNVLKILLIKHHSFNKPPFLLKLNDLRVFSPQFPMRLFPGRINVFLPFS